MDTKIRKLSRKIKALLVESGIQQNDVARGLKVSKQYLANCINIDPKTCDFIRNNPYIRAGIARHLGLNYSQVWEKPDPFDKRYNSSSEKGSAA